MGSGIIFQSVSNGLDFGSFLSAHSAGDFASALLSVAIDTLYSQLVYGSWLLKVEIVASGALTLLSGGLKIALVTAAILVPFFIARASDFQAYQSSS